jgi:D-alanyl-lipoteichoic acid acyltransferase DltB (MBOAT superfamily)
LVFSTIIFLFRFLPITLALYYLAPAKLKNTVLFLCSLVFYCWGEVRFFPVMVALILINYISGLCIEHFDQKPALRRTFLLIALIGSLGMLFYFKYANFVLRSANALLGTAFAEIQGIGTLPLGISFYTFQTLSYSIDVYRRDVKAERNIIDFGAYVVMFPQLIAGPIVKYRDVSNQLHVYRHRYSLQQIEEGMTLFTFGLAKKVLLADAIGALWTDIIGVADSPSTTFVGLANASTPLVWLGIIAYSLQLYFDFSGYSMMGIGMGKMLGFDFPANFNYPYISASITEFWRRWHMTLSGWFREYVYIPLGGNRKGLKRQIFNLLLLVSALLVFTDWFNGYTGYSLDLVVPILCCVALGCNFVFAFLRSRFTANALVYLLMNIGIGLLPYILLFLRLDGGKLDAHSIPWVICLILSIITFLGLVIFRGRALKSEIEKRLHL